MDRLLFQKAASFCAYQERTQDEVRNRLKKWFIEEDEIEEIISELISQNYLSEERFSKTYAGGKFRIKHWGRLRIKQELNRRGLSSYNIDQGLRQIEDKEYEQGLKTLLIKKYQQLKLRENDAFTLKTKLYRFALQKGYESDLIQRTITAIMNTVSED